MNIVDASCSKCGASTYYDGTLPILCSSCRIALNTKEVTRKHHGENHIYNGTMVKIAASKSIPERRGRVVNIDEGADTCAVDIYDLDSHANPNRIHLSWLSICDTRECDSCKYRFKCFTNR